MPCRSNAGSCPRPLRIIIAPRKPGKMPSFHHHLRGHCHGTNPLFLPARARCTGVVLPHALLAVAQRRRCPSPADRAIQATPTPPFSRPQTVCGPDAQTALCPVCARSSAAPSAAAGATRAAAPDSSTPPHDRHTSTHFCPHTGCRYRGWLGLGNLRANGHPSGGPWRQCHCTACQGYFPEHHGTIFHGQQSAVELIVRVLACLPQA